MVPATVKRTVTMPTLMSRRILNDHQGRGEAGARLKDLYVCGIPGRGWLVQNFAGALLMLDDPGLTECPFPLPLVHEEPSVEELVAGEIEELDSIE